MLKIIRIVFYLVLFFFILDIFNLFQTKLSIFKTLIYYSVFLFSIPLLVMEFKAKQGIAEPILRKAIPVVTIIGLVYLNPLKILFHTQSWKTQEVNLINKNNKNHKVEIQSKDLGALGYSKRNAETYYITDYFFFVLSEEYDDRNFIGTDWKRIDSKK